MKLGNPKQTKRLVLAATGAVGCTAMALVVVMLPLGPTNVQTLAGSTGTPAAFTTSSAVNNPFALASPARNTTGKTLYSKTTTPTRSAKSAVGSATATTGSQTTPTTPANIGSSVARPRATVSAQTNAPAQIPAITAPPITHASTSPTTTPTTTAIALAARTQPSSAAITQALVGLKSYVHSILSPSASEVATLGNDVCTAFDQGATDAQVQAALTQKLGSLPFTTILPGAANYVVSSAVSLYCPGYASKLS